MASGDSGFEFEIPPVVKLKIPLSEDDPIEADDLGRTLRGFTEICRFSAIASFGRPPRPIDLSPQSLVRVKISDVKSGSVEVYLTVVSIALTPLAIFASVLGPAVDRELQARFGHLYLSRFSRHMKVVVDRFFESKNQGGGFREFRERYEQMLAEVNFGVSEFGETQDPPIASRVSDDGYRRLERSMQLAGSVIASQAGADPIRITLPDDQTVIYGKRELQIALRAFDEEVPSGVEVRDIQIHGINRNQGSIAFRFSDSGISQAMTGRVLDERIKNAMDPYTECLHTKGQLSVCVRGPVSDSCTKWDIMGLAGDLDMKYSLFSH